MNARLFVFILVIFMTGTSLAFNILQYYNFKTAIGASDSLFSERWKKEIFNSLDSLQDSLLILNAKLSYQESIIDSLLYQPKTTSVINSAVDTLVETPLEGINLILDFSSKSTYYFAIDQETGKYAMSISRNLLNHPVGFTFDTSFPTVCSKTVLTIQQLGHDNELEKIVYQVLKANPYISEEVSIPVTEKVDQVQIRLDTYCRSVNTDSGSVNTDSRKVSFSLILVLQPSTENTFL